MKSRTPPPRAAARSTSVVASATRRGFHWSNRSSLPKKTRRGDCPRAVMPASSPERVNAGRGLLGAETGLGERSPCPREALPVPPGERRQRDALAGRVHEPAFAGVDPCVVDLGRLRPRSLRAEEDHVARLELRVRDPL